MFGIFGLQSSYSLLQSTIPLDVLIDEGKRKGYDFIALSDDRLYGLTSLFQLCKKHQVKPVLGLTLRVKSTFNDTLFYTYVKDEVGYHNLLKIILINDQSELTLDDLSEYQEGLFFVTAGQDSQIDQLLFNQDIEGAYQTLKIYQEKLKDLYIGLSFNVVEQNLNIAPMLYALSEKLKIKLLPIHPTRYKDIDDRETYEALVKISGKEMPLADADFHFLDKQECIDRFIDYPYIFDTVEKVISKIQFNFDPPTFEMPDFPVKNGSQETYLKSLSILGLKKRLKKIKNVDEKKYQNRLLYELSIIHRMGYDNYFLIVYDFVRYAKTHDILVGPGRGSSAGSLVAFCLGITDVDPIKYDLLFERFLNPDRISMPDIDMDFPDNKRDEVINYVAKKYGRNHIASIITFGTFALRSSIRDIARVMNIDQARINGIIKRVIDGDIDETDYEMTRLLRVAKTIEGLPRHTGTHAAGIILSKQDLSNWIPLQKGIYDFHQTQLEAKDLEALGLLKIDFLGIRNLTVIDDVLKAIQKQGETVDIHTINLSNQKAYTLLSNAETTGIFQLESMGMRAVLRKLKPETFEDIVAILALYRPGPMDHIDTYIARRRGEPYTLEHELLNPILSPTYGIIVYQEQIMRIAHEFAGYTLAEADLLRRGISKKDLKTLEDERIRFLKKCEQVGHDPLLSEKIYDLIVKFADYGFNRSHSVAYALVAYQMAYLKANYFPIFMAILMSSVVGNEGLTMDYILEVKRQGIQILQPDINKSTDIYQYENGAIRIPILAIKGIGKSTYDKFIEERNKGDFVDFLNFKSRMSNLISEKNIEMMIHAGALDGFGINHQTMILNKSIEYAGYASYITDFVMIESNEFSFAELIQFEKEALGFNLIYHPMIQFAEQIKKQGLKDLTIFDHVNEAEVVAYIKKMKTIKTKQGKPMAFIELDDGQTQREATIFTDTYQQVTKYLTNDVQVFKMRVNEYRKEKTLVLISIRPIK